MPQAEKDVRAAMPMHVTTVMPLVKAGIADELTYFSKSLLPTGAVISIPLRGKKGKGIVLSSVSAEREKLTIKRGGFALKKILSTEGTMLFTDAFLQASESLSREYAATIGSVIRSLVPSYILEHGESAPPHVSKQKGALKSERSVLEAPWPERVALYQRMIRSAFARNTSVMVIAPTIEEVHALTQLLQKGIEHRVFSITGDVPKKKFLADWKEAVHAQEAVAIIGTPLLLSLPRTDIGIILIERESARSYTLPTRPYLHVPTAAHALCKALGASLILADETLSLTTAHELLEGSVEMYDEYVSPHREFKNVILLDVRRNPNEPKRTYSSIHPKLEHAVRQTIADGRRVFLFTTRRGLGTAIVCNDCGERVSCATCGGAVTLRNLKQKRVFHCSACESTRSAHERCGNCTSWNLLALGIGSERVHADATKLFPKNQVFLLDQGSARDHKKASAIRDAWKNSPGGILVGTELALPYIREGVSLTGIASLDSLLALPEWRVHERVYSLITTLAGISETLIIQTRRTNEDVLRYAIEHRLRDFREKELSLRKQFRYPPFALIITLTVVGSPARVLKESSSLLTLFKPWNPAQHATSAPRGQTRSVLVLRVDTPLADDLLRTLRTLPPYVAIAFNPESTY